MEFISRYEFNKQNLGRGHYASVYHYNDKAIKLYHEILYKEDIPNSCLKLKRKKFTLMKIRAHKIKHTFLVEDLVYMNGAFSGVVYPYIEGMHLGKILDTLTIQEKQKIGKEIIRNAKELTDNKIYHKDYRLPNIIKDNDGKIRIIDLDDIHTKVTLFPAPLSLLFSLNSLKRVLIDLLEDEDFHYHRKSSQLKKYAETFIILNQHLITYKDLNQYVDKKTKQFKTLFINVENLSKIENLNLKTIDIITKYASCNLILVSKTFDKSLMNFLFQNDISLYDYADTQDINLNSYLQDYLKKHNISKHLLLDESELNQGSIISESIDYLSDKSKSPKIKTL